MSERIPESEEERRIDREAAAWLIERDRGLSAARQDTFFQWLADDPRHGECFARHQRTWQEFNLLAEWKPEHSAEPNPDLLAVPGDFGARVRRLVWIGVFAVAASVAVVLLPWRWGSSRPPEPTALVARDYLRQVLEDGSVVELNRGARLEIAYTVAERRVRLLAGEANFTVAKNPLRPFVVRAGGVDVRAVGTVFNVRLGEHAVDVLVTEGKVRIDDAIHGGSVVAASSAGEPPLLLAGSRVSVPVVPPAPVTPELISPADVARQLAWRPELLEFNSAPLSEVAAAFNRRNTVQIEVADPALLGLPIVASFQSDNVEGFVRLLELSARIKAERTGDRIVLRAAP